MRQKLIEAVIQCSCYTAVVKILDKDHWKNSVCYFLSMKSPVELNSLSLKFFCYITWDATPEALQTKPLRKSLLFLQNKSLKTTANWIWFAQTLQPTRPVILLKIEILCRYFLILMLQFVRNMLVFTCRTLL